MEKNKKRVFIGVTEQVPEKGKMMDVSRFSWKDGRIRNQKVITSDVVFVTCLGKNLYRAETANSSYILYVRNDSDVWNLQNTSEFIGFSGYEPKEGLRLICTRLKEAKGEAFIMEDVLTSQVLRVSYLGNGIHEVRTRNSTYYILGSEET